MGKGIGVFRCGFFLDLCNFRVGGFRSFCIVEEVDLEGGRDFFKDI